VLAVEVALAVLGGPGVPYERPPEGTQPFGDPGAPGLRLVVLGDSTAVGQGAPPPAGIAAGVAEQLAAGGRRVALRNLAVSGATWADVRRQQAAPAAALRPDVVFVSAGANDVTAGRRAGAVRDDVAAVVRTLRAGSPAPLVVITGVPDMGSIPRFAQPLRWLVGRRGAHLDAAVRAEAERLRVPLVPIAQRTGPAFRRDPSLFAADRFHPDARGYAVWRAAIAPTLRAATAS
jgi:lysophospholipase L1-like esterase